MDTGRVDRLPVALCLESFTTAPEAVVWDPDATDIPLHGTQEERFFHGYYDEHSYRTSLFVIGRPPVLVWMLSEGWHGTAREEDLDWLLGQLLGRVL